MDWLEEQLKLALERKEPPCGFAERVIRRAHHPPARQWHRWLAAAAAVVVIATAALGYRQHQGYVAREKVMRAFEITAVKVNYIRNHVREAVQ